MFNAWSLRVLGRGASWAWVEKGVHQGCGATIMTDPPKPKRRDLVSQISGGIVTDDAFTRPDRERTWRGARGTRMGMWG